MWIGRRAHGNCRETRGVQIMKKLFQRPVARFGLILGATLAVCGLCLPQSIANLFGTVGMPHSHCYLDDPRMIWLHVVSDLLIGLAYVSISTTLAYLVYRARRNIPFHWMLLAFGLFIVSCGFTHFMEVWTVWSPVYWLAGYVKVITAVASVVTAVALFPLVPKIFELVLMERIAEERRVKLAAANRELEAFASTISHDLRAPLRTMQGMARALKEEQEQRMPEESKFYVERIIHASERMDTLIHDLLAYSRMNLAEFELRRIDLSAVMEDVGALVAGTVKERNAKVEYAGTFPAVRANESLLVQVLSNLLINAMKFTAEGVTPEVKVTGEVRGDRARVSVRDNGIGIAPEYHERIFRMFERLHTATEYPGTGVGLAIVQRAVARMGGTMGLESTPGKGSTFWFELPLA
jgi:signal transduction histidine kinase